MLGFQNTIHLDVGARRAEVSSRAFALAGAAENLDFKRCREILFDLHRLRGFAVDHHAAVAESPAGAAFDLLAGEAVFETQAVVRVFLRVEQVPEAVVPLRVVRVVHLEHAILDAEGILEILARLAAADFRRPAAEILAVEQRGPLGFLPMGKSRERGKQ